MNTEAALNELGVGAMSDQIVGYLVNRLLVEQWYGRHPEIDEQQIVAPLFGLGLPRTGSTALSFLLAQDPGTAVPARLGGSRSVPATGDGDRAQRPPHRRSPRPASTSPTRCFPASPACCRPRPTVPRSACSRWRSEFRSLIFEGMSYVPSYTEWLLQCDMEPAYRYHRRVLKLLQWRCPPDRWWLKTPAHMLSIDALDAVYPDARFVMTHRDVGKVLPSVCSLYSTLATDSHATSRPGGHRHPQQRGLADCARAVDRVPRPGNEGRFHDLSFEAVQRDPIGQVSRLYAELGDDLGDEARRRMSDWWSESSKDRSGPGSYAPEDFGLDLTTIADTFAFYNERFGDPRCGLSRRHDRAVPGPENRRSPMSSIFVTGGTGLTGANVCEQLIRAR